MSPGEADAPRWQINPLQIPRLPASISVGDEGVTLGRDDSNTVALPASPGVSSNHARLCVEDGLPVLEDLGSRNGTFVRGEAIERVTLQHGDIFELGPSGPRFVVLSSSLTDKTVAIPRPDVAGQRHPLGTETVRMMKAELGIEEDEGVAEMLHRKTRRERLIVAFLAVVIAGAGVYGYWALNRQGEELEERTVGLAEKTQSLEERATQQDEALRQARASLEAQARDWREWDARIETARASWEKQKAALEEEQEKLEEDIRRVEEDERSATGELQLLRERLETTARELQRYNPVNLEQEKLARVSSVEQCTVLVEAVLRYREESTGELLHVEETGGIGTFNLKGEGEPFGIEASGSGFSVTPDGWVITNAHVIHQKNRNRPLDVGEGLVFVPDLELSVVFSGESTRREAKLVALANEGEEDLALLRIEPFPDMPHLDPPDTTIAPPLNGSDVFLIGFPLGKSVLQEGDVVIASAFRGIVSRTVGYYVQVDAAVHPGASGGPVIDGMGRVLGVVVGMQPSEVPTSGSAIGFVIPVREVGKIWPPPEE